MQAILATILGFVRDLYESRYLIYQLALRDYKQQNQGSYLGVVWNYFQPMLFVGIMYLVFTFGFRAGIDTDVPFNLYLISGIVCWLYLVANLSSVAYVIKSYSFLVKKVDFRLSILPIVKLLSSFLPHCVLTLLAILLAAMQGFPPTWHLLQLIYYFLCMVLLLLGFGWITSSTNVFIKDVGNIVAVITQFGFWLTPIFWRIETMPEKIQWVLKLNPAFYLVTGYRDSILSQQWFWERGSETATFMVVTFIFLFLGILVFKKLKPHFAEVM